MRLNVNGTEHEVEAPPGAFLLDVLRDRLGLLGTKEACDEGECGACSVLVDGEAVDSCIYFAHAAAGREVTTIEGLGEDHPVVCAFVEAGAVQCGFCTPGFVVAATALLRDNPNLSREEIRTGLAGNLCRCTGYGPVVDAIASVTQKGLSYDR